MISALFSFTATCRAWVELNILFFLAATSPKPKLTMTESVSP